MAYPNGFDFISRTKMHASTIDINSWLHSGGVFAYNEQDSGYAIRIADVVELKENPLEV
jgi:hypothetical protein